MTRILTSTCIMATSLIAVAQTPPPRLTAPGSAKFAGKEARICGRVVTYRCSDARGLVLLDLDKPYWVPGESIGIGADDRPAFGNRFEDDYLTQDVCATGRFEKMDGRLVVMVDKPEALAVQNANRPATSVFAPDAIQNCSTNVEKPTLILNVAPRYTAEAMRRRVHGSVLIDAVVVADGTVHDTRVVYSLDRETGLDDQAVRAVRSWRFVPGKLQGQIVPMIVQIQLTFTMK
jgi:TonB family protein